MCWLSSAFFLDVGETKPVLDVWEVESGYNQQLKL